MAAFFHQRFRYLAPIYRKLAVIHQTPPAGMGIIATCRLWATRADGRSAEAAEPMREIWDSPPVNGYRFLHSQ